MLKVHLETLGITVRCSVRVTELFGDERVAGVRLADGAEIAADQVLIAAGIRPNKYLALQAGLTANSGVVVDDEMRTSDPSIFAAGDVAEHRGVVHGLWPVALGQGAVAGANAAGHRATFFGTPPTNQLKVLDLGVLSIGVFNPTDATYQVFEHRGAGHYRRLVARDGVLVGANLLGDLRLAGPLKMALETGLPLKKLPAELRSLPELARATG
jgi:NAD(P)H-nitrite reductase large subunit